uniref:Uncharacterized protein n=1 Tax=Vespula pensylvanica TaxID=30213 RepID=A0A834U403_VESPE|nr:hypothetical protein H0235_012194 [Vespula pensylvanica]
MKSTILILFAAFIALLGFFGMNAEAAANPSADALAAPSADANAEALDNEVFDATVTLRFSNVNYEPIAKSLDNSITSNTPLCYKKLFRLESNIKQNYITGMKSLILLLIVVITMTFSKVDCIPIAQPRAESWNNADLCEKFKKPGQSPPIICF